MYKIIAIDGPASSGKTSLAKKLSKKLNAPILFSGKLYRAIAFEMIKNNIKIGQSKKILKMISELNEDKLREILKGDKNFQYISRHLPPYTAKNINTLGEPSLNFEKEYLTSQLKKFSGNISKTAKFVGMERSALHRKLKLLGIKEFN